MNCIKCEKKIPGYSKYCLYCGKKQPEKKKPPRREKGTGSIKQRKNKYQAYASNKYIGSATTIEGAEQMLTDYFDGIENKVYTVKDIFDRYYALKSATWSPNVAKQTQQRFDNYFDSMANEDITTVKAGHYQALIDDASEIYSRDICEKIRTIIKGICAEAMKDDLINKNYGELLVLPKKVKAKPTIFTDKEIKAIQEHSEDLYVQVILVLIFTGLRPNELFNCKLNNIHLDDKYMITGSKTDAGIERIIPLADYIIPFIENIIKQSKRTLMGSVCTYDNFVKRKFHKALELCGVDDEEYSPYTCRHTFYTLAKKNKVDNGLLIKVFGHADESVGIENYYHPEIQEKLELVNSLTCV